jgi:tetratricopeptide (TPR) repeat protein
MQAKYPGADLSRYFAFLDAATGEDHAHHSAPRAEFPELATEPENIRAVSFQEHFYAHYLLALAVPECRPFQTTVYFMANIFAREIRTDELPFFAEVYERGMRAHAECLKALNADPEFAKARDARTKALHADPEFAKARDERLKALNADPEFAKAHAECGRKHMKALNADPEFKKASAERGRKQLKALNADPEFAKARDEQLKALNADPEFAKARDERLKALNADPEFAKARDARTKALNARRRAERSLADALIAYMHESQPGIKSLTALV